MAPEAAAMDLRSDAIDAAPGRAFVNQPTRPHDWMRLVWFGLAAASVVGCASHAPLASAKVAQAERAVDDAQQAGAGASAQLELRTAQDKLRDAQTALAKGKNDQAIRSAEQAAIDGDYARAVAVNQRANTRADEMGQYIKVLRQELERLP
jgi:uncharacterized protein DUF4398